MWNSSPNLGSHYVFLCPSYNPCKRDKYILPVPGDVASSSGPESPVPSPGLGISMQVSAPRGQSVHGGRSLPTRTVLGKWAPLFICWILLEPLGAAARSSP